MHSAEVKEWSLDIDKFLPLDIGSLKSKFLQ